MTTGWKTLTRRDLTTFDTFATDAVLTAMQLGGEGRIQTNGHAKIRGTDGIMTIARDTSAPHCRGNVMAALKRAFPEMKTNGATKKDPMTTSTSQPEANAALDLRGLSIQGMVECPAKGCDEKFSTLAAAEEHVHAEHFICKWEGCSLGPNDGPFVGRTGNSLAGHTNIRHKGNKPWEKNREQAAAGRAATVAAKRAAREEEGRKARALLDLPGTDGLTDDERAKLAAEYDADMTLPLATVTLVEDNRAHPERGLPRPERHVAGDAEAKLALIRELLGEDPELVALRKEVADLKAHLALVREAIGLDFDEAGTGN